jgi:N-acetylneuraminate synthase
MSRSFSFGARSIGDDAPTFVVAEIGINHNGSIELARKLIDAACDAGCDAVKFQKRTPELCVPLHQRDVPRETPWGRMTYFEYRQRLEFGEAEYREIARYCADRGIAWFASVWDEEAVEFLEPFDLAAYKIPSAALTDFRLLERVARSKRPVILSTGMSTLDQIRAAVQTFGGGSFMLTHTTSTYPCPPQELNLRLIPSLRREFGVPIGYSGHEVGLQTTYAAVVLGACLVERHITLDRAMWGADQAASVEPGGFARLVRDIRVIESAMGDGVKRVFESELPVMRRLRREGIEQ